MNHAVLLEEVATGFKTCSNCSALKPVSEFYVERRAKSGLKSECKSCVHKRTNTPERYKINTERQKVNRKKDPRQHMLYAAKGRAKKLGLPFDLTICDIRIPEICPVLGIKMEVASGSLKDNSPSLDKFIPELGYVKSNVSVMSWRANALKKDASVSEIEAIVNYVRENIKEPTRPKAENQQGLQIGQTFI